MKRKHWLLIAVAVIVVVLVLVNLRARRERGLPVQVEEVLLQSYLFLGYPIVLNAFALWREITGREAEGEVPDEWVAWEERGEGVCRTVYGGQVYSSAMD